MFGHRAAANAAVLGVCDEACPFFFPAAGTIGEDPVRVSFDAKRTQVAQSAFDFAKYFSGIFDGIRVGGGAIRKPILVAPEGMSTAGGKRARQSLVLHPDDPMATVVTVGWVDIGERRAMMRTHAALELIHRERFRGRPFDVDPASYATFFEQARSFLQSCGFNVKVESDAAPSSVTPGMSSYAPPPNVQASGNSSSLLVAAAAFFIGVLVGGLVVYARLVWIK
jgi:hypothetical protein